QRWDWIRPRAVPLLAAFAGLLMSLGIVKYTSQLSYDHDLATRPRALPALPRATHCWSRAAHHPAVAPIQLPSPAVSGDEAGLPAPRAPGRPSRAPPGRCGSHAAGLLRIDRPPAAADRTDPGCCGSNGPRLLRIERTPAAADRTDPGCARLR